MNIKETLNYFATNLYNKTKNSFVEKEDNKGLSSNDYTDEDKNKLGGLPSDTYTKSEINNALSGKSDTSHTHDDRYYTESEINTKLSEKSDTSHTHDDRYYTETEIDNKLSTKSDTLHNHDSSYYKKSELYTKTETDNKLSSKSDTSHNHDGSYYTKSEINNKLSNLPTNAESTSYSNSASGLSATNVQGAIDEVDTKVDDLSEYVYGFHPLPRTMTVIIDKTDSNPETCITYADDAIGMTPGSDEWDSFFGHYPCLFKDGKEVGKLNPNNFAQFEDGTSADITSGNAGDVMIAFPKLGYKITSTNTTLTVSMTNSSNLEGYCYLAHTRGTTVKDKFYLGAYKGYVSSNKLRSLSGKSPTGSKTISTFRTYAQANGSGYDQIAFNQLVFIQCMYLLKYKNLNSRNAVGNGYAKETNYGFTSTGGTNTKGMDFGETTGSLQMKLFGLEDLWGNFLEFIDGIYCDSSYNILTATENFNDTGSGYINQGSSGFSKDTEGYIKDVQGKSETGFILKSKNGSSSTYYCSYGRIYSSCVASLGDCWEDENTAIFKLYFDYTGSSSAPAVSARLMFL